jgi:hypothetical protein
MTKSIILHADEIRPLLAGQPVTVRREVKPQPVDIRWAYVAGIPLLSSGIGPRAQEHNSKIKSDCNPGDVLRVRETWGAVWPDADEVPLEQCVIEYRADLPPGCTDYPGSWPAEDARGDDEAPKWHSPATMPAWASRLTVRVKAVTVEQVGGKWMWCYALEREG